MKKYRSPDGTIYTEDEAKKIFGTNFASLIQDGQLQVIEEEVSISEVSYKSPDGTVYSELQAREVFGNNFESLIEDGQLQKQELDIEDIQNIEDVQNNALIVDNTIVDGIPFADLNFEEQSNYINRAGNYAENEKGDLLFLPKNRQEVDMTWNLPKDKSGRRYFPDQLTGGLFDEISEEEISTETIPPAPPRQGTRPNVDDQNNVVSESTHLMKAEQLEDGNWVAFPSLFQNPNGEWVDMSGEKNWEPIYQEALKRGEVIEFGKNKKAAIAYGEGSWKEKDTPPFPDLSLENLSTRGNRNENVEILSDYTIAKKPYSTVHVNGKRVLPANINKDAPNIAITIADETLNLLNINKQDYVNWERETLREESERFKTSQGLIRWDEGEKLAIEKRNAEKLSAYMITLSKGIEQDLDIVNAKLKFISDPVERAKLEAQREVLKQDLFNNLKGRIKLVETNDYLKNQKESETAKNRNIFLDGQEGGLSYGLTETKNTLKSIWNVIPQFYGGILRMIASIPDQGLTLAGDDKKGVLSAIDEALGRVQEQLSFDIPQRSSFMGGKKVYSVVNGENHPFIVTPEGQILDEITHVNMQGILTDQQYESILKNSKEEKSETFFSPGAFVPTAAYTVINLFALIASGKWITKTINKGLKKVGSKSKVPGGLGMGISSYASTAVGEVEDIRATLVRSGMSEKEAMKYAIAAGNSRATLDGIFSGLAGSNVKLLTSTKDMGKAIIDIAKKPGTWKVGGKFTTKTFEKKVKELAKENFKEVFVEELPVLYSGKGINSIVNSLLEEDILDEKVKTAEVYETIAMTIAATSIVGSKNLLQGNSRSALVDLAATSPDLKKTIDKLVQDGMITKEEGASAYDEIYGMQIANNISEGAITLPHNKTAYSNLAEQRKTLVEQAKNLEGPGKERVQKKIEALDAQLEALIVKDEGEIKTELEKEKEKSPNLVTTEEARASLEQENEIKTRSGKGVIIRLTDEAIETRRQELNKEKQDAIQKPSTEKVDVQKPAKDSGKVGKGDTTGDITTEGKKKDQVTPKKTAQEEVKTKALPKKPLPTRKERVSKIVSNVINKTKARKVGTDTNPQIIADNVIGYLQGSKLYEESTDSEREAIIQDINKKLGLQISSPSVNKVLGKKRKKLSKVDEAAALKDQIKLEVKAARDAKKDQTSRRKALGNAIRALQKAGTINTRKMNTLLSQISNVNLNNPVAVTRVLNYVEKVNNDANAEKKINDATKLKNKIRNQLKNKNIDGEVSNAAKEFLNIDINLVTDLDAYLKEAVKVSEGLSKSRVRKDGSIDVKDTVDIKALDKYTTKTQREQQKILKKAQAQAFRDITGLNSNEFTLDEMQQILYGMKSDTAEAQEEQEKKAKEKENIISKGVKKAFQIYKSYINKMIETGIDPITGEKIKLTKKKKETIKQFMKINLDLLNPLQQLQALDSMINFATNQSTGKMSTVINNVIGIENAAIAQKKGIIAQLIGFTSKLFGGNEYISQLPLHLELLFKGQTPALLFEKLSGLTGVRFGASKAYNEAQKIAKQYSDKFIKPKNSNPNGEPFNSLYNITERGLLGFMRRTVDGTKEDQRIEFNKRKSLIKQSIEVLKKEGDPKLLEAYQKAYDKVLKDSNTINDVDNKVDPINKEASQWMIDLWASKREELSEVSLNVYNRVLGKDLNYTPDSFTLIDPTINEPEIGEPLFQGNRETIYDKETGVLMPKTMSNKLPFNRIVNLGFDNQNINNYEAALSDIYTAESIQQLKGFVNSPTFDKIFPNSDDRKNIKNRLRDYVNAKRGVSSESDKNKKLAKILNNVSSYGVSRILGGFLQYPKQLVPIVNTAWNLMNNPGAFIKGMQTFLNPDAQQWLNNIGYEITNRGIQAITTLDGLNNKIEEAAETRGGKFANGINNLQKWWLQQVLINPDKIAARTSFMAYYIHNLSQQGLNTKGIDWKTHKINHDAAAYAQQQVARQQNTSDQDLQGRVFSSKNIYLQFLRKTVFPFQNFLLNQKTRMNADIVALSNPLTSIEDKFTAARSLGGLMAETATFQGLSLFFVQVLANSLSLLGYEDEEEKEKAFLNRVKGRGGNIVTDLSSPIPPTNPLVLGSLNTLFRGLAGEDDKPFQFFNFNDKTAMDALLSRLGSLGIAPEKALEIIEMIKLSATGKYTNNYGNIKLTSEAQEAILPNVTGYILYSIGLLPAEVGSIVKYNIKYLKKQKEKKPIKITPPKKKSKKPERSGGPVSPFKGRRKKTGPSSPF